MGEPEIITRYTGIPTFFRSRPIGLSQITDGMTVVAGVPVDHGVVQTRPGARYGPREIRAASLLDRGLYDIATDQTMIDIDTHKALRLKQDLNIGDLGDFAIVPTDILKTTDVIRQGVADVVRRGGRPVVLGGDHYIAYPSFDGFVLGMAERKPDLRLGYVHIDSHPDFRDVHATAGRITHGTCVRRISENAATSFRNMAWLGLNGAVLDADMYRLLRQHDLKMLSAKRVHERGVKDTVREAVEVAAEGTDAVYVSVDIDVVDGSESPGTGSIVFSGIRAREFLEIMDVLGSYDVIRAIDMCEVAPSLDPTERTAQLAASGLVAFLAPRLFDTVELRR